MLEVCKRDRQDIRDHFLEALKCLLDVGAGGHIVLYSFDEWGIRDATVVRGGILAVRDAISIAQLTLRDLCIPELDLFSHFVLWVVVCCCYSLEATRDWAQA